MTGLQTIMQEINHLDQNELELLMLELRKRLDQQNQIEAILDEYIGLGVGIWHSDAQEYVKDLRAEDSVLEGEKQEA